MKITVGILSLGLALCVGSAFYQNHRATKELARQEAAIARVQSRYDAALQENRALKIELQKKAATEGAYTTALAIAARYQKTSKR